MKRKGDGDAYVDAYPHVGRWLNTCKGCGATGYDPEMPENIGQAPSTAAKNLRRMYRPLGIDEKGLCEQCRDALCLDDDSQA